MHTLHMFFRCVKWMLEAISAYSALSGDFQAGRGCGQQGLLTLRAGTTPDRDPANTITAWSCTGACTHKYACAQPLTRSGSLVVTLLHGCNWYKVGLRQWALALKRRKLSVTFSPKIWKYKQHYKNIIKIKYLQNELNEIIIRCLFIILFFMFINVLVLHSSSSKRLPGNHG